MDELPYSVQSEIFIGYLFQDFLYTYRFYFSPKRPSTFSFCQQEQKEFLVDFVKCLEPRMYKQTDQEMIQDQYEEVHEVVFIQRGQVAIGYRLFNETFYGKRMRLQDGRNGTSTINDYSCLYNKCSEFLYRPIDQVHAFATRIDNYSRVMSHHTAKAIRENIVASYKYLI